MYIYVIGIARYPPLKLINCGLCGSSNVTKLEKDDLCVVINLRGLSF